MFLWRSYPLEKEKFWHRLYNIRKSKNVSQEITIYEKYLSTTGNIDDFKLNNTQVNHSFEKYVQKKENVNFILINKNEFMNSSFWKRVHEHLINITILPNDGCKYIICQVLRKDNEFAKYMEDDGSLFIKETKFSYIR